MHAVDIARKFAAALDAEDYEAARVLLAEACVYHSPAGELVGPEAILASYRGVGESARERFESIEYTSDVVEQSPAEAVVEFIDRIQLSKASLRRAKRPHPNPLPKGEGTKRPHPNPLPKGEGTMRPHPSPLPEGEGTDGRDNEAGYGTRSVPATLGEGIMHEYRCQQALRIDANGLIAEIRHIELPGQREQLDEFLKSC